MNIFSLAKYFIYKLQPETAHNLAIIALKHNLLLNQSLHVNTSLHSTVMGIKFKNPVGMAAGFDKNADAIKGLISQGFGFVEVGTVTPKFQSGNEKPRLFRLTEDEAIVNRMGFNNKGADYYVQNLQTFAKNKTGIVGANIGKNKTTENPISDYIILLKEVYGLSDYITINISSPNTPGLRDLQHKGALDSLLTAIMTERNNLAQQHNITIPIVVKIAPDIDLLECENIAEVATNHAIDGLIISNTTLSRDGLNSKFKDESGGMSGKPLMDKSTDVLRNMYKLTGGNIPIIGVGGISSANDAYAKIRAGASLVQVYSALIYQGFGLVQEINDGLVELLARDGFDNISDAVGADH